MRNACIIACTIYRIRRHIHLLGKYCRALSIILNFVDNYPYFQLMNIGGG